MSAVDRWHDPAGMTILGICVGAILLAAVIYTFTLRRRVTLADEDSVAPAARKARPVVVRGVAVDRVDVIDPSLRRVLDDEIRSLNPVVRRAVASGRDRRGAAPRLAGVLDVDGQPVIVSEFISGVTLKDLLDERRFPNGMVYLRYRTRA